MLTLAGSFYVASLHNFAILNIAKSSGISYARQRVHAWLLRRIPAPTNRMRVKLSATNCKTEFLQCSPSEVLDASCLMKLCRDQQRSCVRSLPMTDDSLTAATGHNWELYIRAFMYSST